MGMFELELLNIRTLARSPFEEISAARVDGPFPGGLFSHTNLCTCMLSLPHVERYSYASSEAVVGRGDAQTP